MNANEDGFRWRERDLSDRNEKGNDEIVAHQANRLAKSVGERMKDIRCTTEAFYERPIPIAILFESLLSLLKELKDVMGGSGKLKLLGEGNGRFEVGVAAPSIVRRTGSRVVPRLLASLAGSSVPVHIPLGLPARATNNRPPTQNHSAHAMMAARCLHTPPTRDNWLGKSILFRMWNDGSPALHLQELQEAEQNWLVYSQGDEGGHQETCWGTNLTHPDMDIIVRMTCEAFIKILAPYDHVFACLPVDPWSRVDLASGLSTPSCHS
ncbi:hypothetical protein F5148DRAFT_1151624 [Russula earlei]|uniref:Uncharacterized protein n=1 Tax=Russula earlei TaxID=71964 RepID=A0ACC0TZH8_9AGAM|nr:hypothetical protein F5148DRAFT_1151624 [Russula earlei]